MSQSTIPNQQTILPDYSSVAQRRSSGAASAVAECRSDFDQLVSGLDFVLPEAVNPRLQACSKEEAIQALVDLLIRAGSAPRDARDELTAAVLRREELATTGIGEGVAIPHTKHTSVTQVVGALAYCPAGLDFASLDGRPVHLIVLLASPPGDSRTHLLALEAAARRISDPRWDAFRNGTVDTDLLTGR